MRLDDFDPNSIDIEDQRGSGRGRGPGGGFPIGMLLGGRMGLGTIVLIVIFALVFKVNPAQLLGGDGNVGGALPGQTQVAAGTTTQESCTVDAASRETCNALSSLNKTWGPILTKSGIPADRPGLVFYSQNGRSGCGAAQSAMGPFYCPSDSRIYLDTDFFRQMDQELGAGGQFARDYVIAHEYGHHIQNLTGTSDKVHQLQQSDPDRANPLSVRLELQADCYAGAWAGLNRDRIEPGDIESGLKAAHQIGDDTLMKSAGRAPVEAAFTHGSSAQRMKWLRRGIEAASLSDCDTFSQGI